MTEQSYLDPQVISLLVACILCVIILAIAMTVVWAMLRGRIDLSHLLSESASAEALPDSPPAGPPKASLSRFQFLVFTFVIAGLYLVLSLETGTLIDVPNGVLILLGISGATYAAGKAMGDKKPPPKP
jgi:uncharacterized membrane protein